MLRRSWLALVLFGPIMLAGCDDYLERKDLEREKRELLVRKAQLEDSLRRTTGGKTSGYTDAEKAASGPVWIELQQVEARIAAIDARLREL